MFWKNAAVFYTDFFGLTNFCMLLKVTEVFYVGQNLIAIFLVTSTNKKKKYLEVTEDLRLYGLQNVCQS